MFISKEFNIITSREGIRAGAGVHIFGPTY